MGRATDSILRRHRRGAAVAAVLAFTAVSAGPVAAAPGGQGGDRGGDRSKDDCTDYGAVADAPKGAIPRDDFISVRKDPLEDWVAENRTEARAAVESAETVTVPVYFHVVRKDETRAGGNVPREQIEAQIDVLNAAFASSGFAFELEGVTRTTQPQWFNLIAANGAEPRLFRGSGKEVKMKQALHTGGPEALNLYSSSLGQFLLGWAYLPWDFTGESGEPLPRYFDGVVVDHRSLPGGSFGAYDEGDTATHEVGHWLGLFHTFDNGCSEPGDFVEDTPYEAVPAFACEERDTCEAPGSDPITNYMDYTPDACMVEFTPGQARRMAQVWEAYRDLG